MLPGDIDLTQNLDFRKQVKKELPQFPATWNGDGKISNKLNYNNFIGNISVLNDYTLTISNTTNDNTRVSIYQYDTDSNIITSSPIVMYRYNNQNTWFEYNTHDDDYLTTSSSTPSITINKYIEPEKDMFGNIIESKQEQQPKCCKCGELLMPWEHSYCSNCNNKFKRPIPDMPWENQNKFKYSLYIDNSYDRIPWEDDEWLQKSEKSQEPICYLADKSQSFKERYLNRFEEDNESYLTNMDWIRVRDAVID